MFRGFVGAVLVAVTGFLCPPGSEPNVDGICVERPDQNPGGATGRCCDGTESHATHRGGMCSHHGGVC